MDDVRAMNSYEETAQEVFAEDLSPSLYMSDMPDGGESLHEGAVILDGRYRITRLLYQRPRLNLYLGERIGAKQSAPKTGDEASLVAIRELVLAGLPPRICDQIETATFEEFISPIVLGSPRLPTRGDRQYTVGQRHYLIMQLYSSKMRQSAGVVTLEDLLLNGQQWPLWLDEAVALEWGMQLCRIVARLHRLGAVLGDLDPATILVSCERNASWAPILLVSWPPAPQFWVATTTIATTTVAAAAATSSEVFPVDLANKDHAFVAPEVLQGVCDVRSDVYSLGAILYLLFTHYAPVAVTHRLRSEQRVAEALEAVMSSSYGSGGANAFSSVTEDHAVGSRSLVSDDTTGGGLELLLPSRLREQISPALEQVLLHALALDPQERYPSAFALVEALELVALERHALIKESLWQRFWRRLWALVTGTF